MVQTSWPNKGKPTIRDVAAAAAVSVRTVSRVINKSPLVNEVTKEHVEGVIKRLDFQPSHQARGLATGRSNLIGLVHSDPNNIVLGTIQRSIVAEVSRRGYELVMHSAVDGEDPTPDILEFVQRSRVDGLVVLAPVSSVAGLGEALGARDIPTAALSSVRLSDFGSVIISNEREGGALAARHLIRLGHTRISFVSGPENAHSAEERSAGFLGELQAAGLAPLKVARGDYGFASGVRAAEMLLQGDDLPTAIFAANDVMAAGALKAAAIRGIKVPDELSVVGLDGSPLAHMLTPSLTTVFRPIGEMAAAAAKALMAGMDGKDVEAPTFELELWERESTAPPLRN